jgi:hypothetical protein
VCHAPARAGAAGPGTSHHGHAAAPPAPAAPRPLPAADGGCPDPAVTSIVKDR